MKWLLVFAAAIAGGLLPTQAGINSDILIIPFWLLLFKLVLISYN
jgi:uncharacterized membrane protein YdcZ (DUF606 family)